MPFETAAAPRSIAVIGSGISGLGAAYALAETHRVVLIEAESRLGGHARTRRAGRRGDLTVDTGFIVFNRPNYPNLVRLFEELDVPTRPSDMSFGASFDEGRFEFGLADLPTLFAQPRNLFRPSYLRMIRDLLRFNREALAAADEDGLTVGGLLEKLQLGAWFRDRYLLPISGAIWSTEKSKILDFPARAMIGFFDNHNLLQNTGQHQWHTVDGGSVEYVSRLARRLDDRGVEIRLATPVEGVRRTALGVEVKGKGGEWEMFDEVVFATHSDDSLALLSDATATEQSNLGAIRYQPNDIVLHGDPSVMPRRRRAWSSWVYTETADAPSDRIELSYWMNSLQRWLGDENVFVTLNPNREIDERLIWDRATLRHPVFDTAALDAQQRVRAMNGANRTWFCGAWMANGFHEDGLASGLAAAEGIAAQDALLRLAG
ncbi:Putative cyclopropane/cyclopropene fatty acid synthesis protein, flavin amine oxidase [Oceanicola granulosus HTCC2516]|uniref:Putative cyclopropane/cyclopropene fatty acid synthesis protein, flavin amine oxidase n=1 Tax=Oceanicola granulosus (strain ATCC BAA-861 / DSM 15982 / KCTC 12143 / HTCC2516) TaxID=314256 RepID=Q2CKE0_OCEGH|nr:FAD-dependent oxidoreductase [Oceanicola granulosus]EAR52849.1 Putative cyclopropane/cyclopropene fatty acid synthesis protein, flavin amine oxidase [Oceanicola granulosus HTCC2516]